MSSVSSIEKKQTFFIFFNSQAKNVAGKPAAKPAPLAPAPGTTTTAAPALVAVAGSGAQPALPAVALEQAADATTTPKAA